MRPNAYEIVADICMGEIHKILTLNLNIRELLS